MERVTIKSSTIFISVGEKTSIYRSLDEVPAPLKKRLHDCTNGINAATILIADRRGREEILRVIQGLPSRVGDRVAASLTGTAPPPTRRPLDWRTWLEILLPAAVGLLIWLAFSYR
jgi:hypothetical protein